MELHTVIDKYYVPRVGDVLSNDEHSLATIEIVYSLNRMSSRINRSYNDQLFKRELLKKVIQRKEIIWDQHKLDYKLFPEASSIGQTGGEKRKSTDYMMYCFYNDMKQYKRLYCSKYRYEPNPKIRVVTSQKTMVRVNHGLCLRDNEHKCYYWGGKHATPLSLLINQKFIYHGNIYSDILESHDWD